MKTKCCYCQMTCNKSYTICDDMLEFPYNDLCSYRKNIIARHKGNKCIYLWKS